MPSLLAFLGTLCDFDVVRDLRNCGNVSSEKTKQQKEGGFDSLHGMLWIDNAECLPSNQEGKSRSVTAAIVFLMRHKGWTFQKAWFPNL